MRSNSLLSYSRGLLIVIATIAAGCADVTCEDRGTCPDNSTPDAQSAASDTASTRETDATIDASPVDASLDSSTPIDGSVRPDGGWGKPDAAIAHCEVNDDCPSTSPICDDSGQCVACTDDAHCNPERPVCSDNQCHACDLTSGEGCTSPTSVCIERTPNARLCVECEVNADCADAGRQQVCHQDRCVVCAPNDSAGCSQSAPICVSSDDTARCVQCLENDDCPSDSPVCLDEQCMVCDLASHAGCDTPTPYCALVGKLPAEATSDAGAVEAGTSEPRTDPADADSEAADPGVEAVAFVRACAECREDTDCSGSTPACVGGACVECASDSNCLDPALATCDLETNLCVPCSRLGDCAHLADTPACQLDSGVCVECTAEEASRCDTTVCTTVPGPEQFTCSDQIRGSAQPCEACLSDAACPTGQGCVREVFGEVDTGWYCLMRAEEGGDCTTERPYVGRVERSSADGVAGPYCRPRHTTCAGYLNHGRGPDFQDGVSCTSHEDCGLEGIEDGYCIPWGESEASNRCTYVCVLPEDCKSGSSCDPAPTVTDIEANVCSL